MNVDLPTFRVLSLCAGIGGIETASFHWWLRTHGERFTALSEQTTQAAAGIAA